MPSWTTVPSWAVGQLLKRVTLDLSVTAIGELQAWATTDDARIATLETFVGTGSARPQLRVYAPASVTISSKVPYASTRKDSHSGWSGANSEYTVPTSWGGLWLIQIGYKCSGTAATPSQYFDVGGTGQMSGPNAVSASYVGSAMSGVLDLAAGDVCSVKEQGASYTPQNDSAGSKGVGSNFLCMTYLGPTT